MGALTVRFSDSARVIDEVDVLVCGGGPAGTGAAIAASRMGARTMLVEQSGQLGGVATQTLIGVWLGSYSRDGAFPVIAGVFQEVVDCLVAEGAALPARLEEEGSRHIGYAKWHNRIVPFEYEPCKRVCEQLCLQSGVQLRYFTTVVQPQVKDNKITGVFVHSKGGLGFVRARAVVDATGDGDITFRAGCPTVKGLDDTGGMAAVSLIPVVENVDYQAFERYCRETGDTRLRNIIARLSKRGEWPFGASILVICELPRRGRFFVNGMGQNGIDGTDAESTTRAMIDGRQNIHLLMPILRQHVPGFGQARLVQTSATIGIRETRRIVGQYVVQDDDLIAGKHYDDTVALSGYRWDLGTPKPSGTPKEQKDVPEDRPPSDEQPMEGVEMARPYVEIPYRSLVPVGVDNLLVAGRCISVSRNALGPLRVMPVCFATGQAAGTAAALTVSQGVSADALDAGRLQEELGAQGAITRPQEPEAALR